MPKSIVIEPREVICQVKHPFVRYPGQRLRPHAGGGAGPLFHRGFSAHLAGYVRDPRVRDHPERDQDQGRLQGRDLQPRRARRICRSGRKRRPWAWPFSLTPDDHIFGSHRSHGEILAKGFSAIRQFTEQQLSEIMKSYRDGAMLRPVEKGVQGPVRELAVRASSSTEPTARSSRARPASTAGWAAPCTRSSRPSASIPTTPSWAARARSLPARRSSSESTASRASWSATSATPRSAAARCGKASPSPPWTSTASCGTQSLGGGLPILFNCMNNFYGMGGQPFGETMGMQFIARIGAGVNPEQMHAERVNGYDPLPVIDAFRRKKQILAGGPRSGPAGHHHLPHQRPLAFRRLQLPLEGRGRALAGGRFDSRFPQAAGRGRTS